MPQVQAPVPSTAVGTKTLNIVGANAGAQVKTGRGVLTAITINTAGTSSGLTVYDGTSTSGTKLGTFSTMAQYALTPLNWGFTTGLFVVTTGTVADLTISYT